MAIAALFAAAERRFSRFLEDSELSRLNRSRGPVVVEAMVDSREYDGVVLKKDRQ